MKTEDLITRARELAKLADGATQGPWKHFVYDTKATVAGDGWVVANCDCQDMDQCAQDAKFICRAPEMAKLLSKMADALEESRKAFSW